MCVGVCVCVCVPVKHKYVHVLQNAKIRAIVGTHCIVLLFDL